MKIAANSPVGRMRSIRFIYVIDNTLPETRMPYELRALPYPMDALQPHISKETLEFSLRQASCCIRDQLERAVKRAPSSQRCAWRIAAF